jgi:FtsH-binding integral membrane protein
VSQGYTGFARPGAAAQGLIERRARFLTRTYNHLFLSILAFAGIEFALFASGVAPVLAQVMMGTSWLLVLGGFMLVSWGASHFAHRAASLAVQYLALGAFIVAEAILFVPLLFIANTYAPGAIQSAGIVTLVGFAGLTAIVFVTRKDFSFLRGILMWGMGIALLLIIGGAIFGFQLGMFFSVAMVALAGAAILYDTSNVIHHYPEDRYISASLQLFASVALMFYYVLMLLIQLCGRD